MHFSIVKINPPDTSPSHGFDDAALPLYFALKSLGYEVEIRFNTVNERSRNIVFGTCIAPRRTGRILPRGSIIFNLEQVVQGSKWCNTNYLTHLKDFTVWDYSAANVDALRALGVPDVVHVPLGYVPEMTRLREDYPTDVDALFYGLVTDRRHELITRMTRTGVRLLATQNAFGDLRDRLLAHAKVVLNIHQFLPAKLEVIRLGYTWANKKAVLSEWRNDSEIPDHLVDACLFASYENMPDALERLLQDDCMRKRQAQSGFRAFTSRPMQESLLPVVGRRIRTRGAAALKTETDAEQDDVFLKGAELERSYLTTPVREWLIQPDQVLS